MPIHPQLLNRAIVTPLVLLIACVTIARPSVAERPEPLSGQQTGQIAVAADWSEFSGGEADATAALQRLIDQSDGAVELPPGVFRLTRPLEIDLTQLGYRAIRGSSATRLVMAGPGPALRFRGSHFKSADPGGFADRIWTDERMPTVTEVAIEGAHESADGIEAAGTMQLTIQRVHLRKLRHGIRLIENNRNVIVDSCHIYENSGVGIYYDDVNLHQSNITGCHVSYCGGGGIVSRRGNVRNLHITGCDLESNMSADTEPTANVLIDCRGSVSGTAEVAITGCTIQHNDRGPESANIRIIGQGDPSANGETAGWGHVTITGNVLSDVQTNLWLQSCRGVTVIGNTFWMGFDYNLRVEDSSHVVIGPNNFDRNPRYSYGRASQAKNRLLVRDSADCTLNGLHIAHVHHGEAALTLQNCDRMHVTGLTILDCDRPLRLIDVDRSRITNCLIRDDRPDRDRDDSLESRSAAVEIEGGTDTVLDDSVRG